MPKKIKIIPETLAKISLYGLKKFPTEAAIRPKMVKANINPSENAVVMSMALFLSLNKKEKNVGNKTIEHGEVKEIMPAKKAARKVIFAAIDCSYSFSFCRLIGSSAET